MLLIGAISWIHQGGLDYGIDFKGGTLVYVRFASKPPVDQLRQGLAQQGLGQSVIQQISDISNPNANEVVIYLPQQGQGTVALDAGKSDILNALHATLGAGQPGKQDFNAATPADVAEILVRKDPLSARCRGGRPLPATREAIDSITGINVARGVIANIDDLRSGRRYACGACCAARFVLRQPFRRH